MAGNPIPKALDLLVTLAHDMKSGAHDHEVAAGIKRNTEAVLTARLTAFETTSAAFDVLLGQKNGVMGALRSARSNARSWLTGGRDHFKLFLGAQPSAAWEPAGWSASSIAIPTAEELILPLLGKVSRFLTDNPTRQLTTPELVLTPARGDTLEAALRAARKGRTDLETSLATALGVRDTAEAALREVMHDLVQELGQCLGDLDPRWIAYGLHRPGDPPPPGKPENCRATVLGSGGVLAECDRTPGADRWHFFGQRPGETEWTLLDRREEPQAILHDLAPGPLKLRMRAANDTDSGPFAAAIDVIVT